MVIQDAKDWADNQTAAYSLKEAALLFESGSYKSLDCIIVVTAPEEIRIKRVQERDNISREEVLNRISKQMPENEKVSKADYIVFNDGKQALLPQIFEIHQKILNR